MLTTDIKRKIDNARDILVGKVPDPKAQVDQITNALIYKFMDDMDQEAVDLGGKPQFFNNGYEKYAWSKVMDPKLGGLERLNLYVEAITQLAQNPHIPQLFRDIFKDAYLPYRDPETLSLFLKQINEFTYHHSEELGNSFEYLLSVLGSQGDAGQFRTPRHIIDFIVSVVDPKKTDRILDPACGTAGFLISAYKHIMASHDGKDEGGKPNEETRLTPDERKRLVNSIVGYDISPDMVKLSRVNMYLHGFPEPHISEYDTLTSEDRWDDSFDVILANPPFMTPKGGIRPHKRFSVQANRAEVLFVDYIAEHLSTNGRAGVIVPEGIIFQSGTAYKQLRKMLVENYLYAVVSLPAGVFQPYSGVKTSILFFDPDLAKKSPHIVFANVQHDGFNLGAQRRPIEQNDLPEVIKIIEKFKTDPMVSSSTLEEFATDLAAIKKPGSFSKVVSVSVVPKDKIAESGDYNLIGDRYKAIEIGSSNWETVPLGDILEYEQPTKYIVASTDYKDSFPTPVLTAGKSFILGYTNEKDGVFNHNLPVIIFDDFTTDTKLVDFPFKVKSSAMKILLSKDESVDIRYIFYVMQKLKFKPVEHKRFWISEYSKIKVPLPPIETQKEIVAELEDYQKILNAARTIAENYKPTIKVDPAWPITKLSDVCKTSSGGTPLKSKTEYYSGGEIPWLGSGEVAQGVVTQAKQNISELGLKNSSAKIFPKQTVLVAMYGATAGQVGILEMEASTNQAVCGIQCGSKVLPYYLYYLLKSYRQRLVRLATGGAQPNISQNIIRNLDIPIPDLEKQKQIIEEMGAAQNSIRWHKEMVAEYEQKIQDKIAEVWG